MALIVRKYGGKSLNNSQQISQVAEDLKQLREQGHQIIVVVSAMGQTTDELIELAYKMSSTPNPRELDMLLTSGERISMALLSIALNERQCPSISFTGSQAGVFTDSSHNNARIREIRPIRIENEIKLNRVVVLAGFQGVSPETKEVTTLGRGGSDTTAVAMAAYFHADRLEILKDVEGIFSADPKVVKKVRLLKHLTYGVVLEMSYWGSRVLHFRCVEVAARLKIPIYIGLAHPTPSKKRAGSAKMKEPLGSGTLIYEDSDMLIENQVLAVSSLPHVRRLSVMGPSAASLPQALQFLYRRLSEANLPATQLLCTQKSPSADGWDFYITQNSEIITSLPQYIQGQQGQSVDATTSNIHCDPAELSSVSATGTASLSNDLVERIMNTLESRSIAIHQLILSPLSITVIVACSQREKSMRLIHDMQF